jgi:hypothetical protein
MTARLKLVAPSDRPKNAPAVRGLVVAYRGAGTSCPGCGGRAWPAGRIACHHCDNPICVNPRHIYAGTHSDNSTDSVVRGRTSGQKKTHCKNGHELTEQNVWRYGNMRVCKQCQYARARRSYHRRRMATS